MAAQDLNVTPGTASGTGPLAPVPAMPSPDLSTPMPTSTEPDDPPPRSMESPVYPSSGVLGSPAFPQQRHSPPPPPAFPSRGMEGLGIFSRASENPTGGFPIKSESSLPFSPRSIDSLGLLSRSSDNGTYPTKSDSPPPFPSKGMDMPYSHRLLPDPPLGYSGYQGSFPPSSGAYGAPPVSFPNLPPSFNPGLSSATGGFPQGGATGTPPLETFVQLLLAMNVDEQLKVRVKGSNLQL